MPETLAAMKLPVGGDIYHPFFLQIGDGSLFSSAQIRQFGWIFRGKYLQRKRETVDFLPGKMEVKSVNVPGTNNPLIMAIIMVIILR